MARRKMSQEPSPYTKERSRADARKKAEQEKRRGYTSSGKDAQSAFERSRRSMGMASAMNTAPRPNMGRSAKSGCS